MMARAEIKPRKHGASKMTVEQTRKPTNRFGSAKLDDAIRACYHLFRQEKPASFETIRPPVCRRDGEF